MELLVVLNSNTNNIRNFKSLLEKYRNYESCIRDIKINTILGEKCLFEVEDINPSIICNFTKESITSLSQSAIIINKLSFKINTDLTILELKVSYKLLTTQMDKLITELQKIGIKLDIKPKLNDFLEVTGFYIDKDCVSTHS